MKVERWSLGEPAELAARARSLTAAGADVRADVAAIVSDVRERGDAALDDYVERFDRTGGAALRVGANELDAAAAGLRTDVRRGLEVAMENVAAVAGASLGDDAQIRLRQGQVVTVRELAVRRAAIYVPGGRAPYPSTVIMGAVTARVAGVEEIAVCAPGAHPIILAPCALCGVDEVYRMGGAHAVAALAYGTRRVPRADVVAGPGSLYVQEAKRMVNGDVGIDGFLGPSDVIVVAGAGADPELVALDLLAQAEHGEGTIVGAVSEDGALLDALAERLGAQSDAVAILVDAPDTHAALAFAEAFAPEHLQLVGSRAEAPPPRARPPRRAFVCPGGAPA